MKYVLISTSFFYIVLRFQSINSRYLDITDSFYVKQIESRNINKHLHRIHFKLSTLFSTKHRLLLFFINLDLKIELKCI